MRKVTANYGQLIHKKEWMGSLNDKKETYKKNNKSYLNTEKYG